MILRRRSVLLRVALLVLVPLIFLVALSSFEFASSLQGALTLLRSKVMMDDLGRPVAGLQQALTGERAQAMVYYARPTRAALAGLHHDQAATDRAVTSVLTATASGPVRQDASPGGLKAIAMLRKALGGLPDLRTGIASHAIGPQRAFTSYSGLIAASYQVLEQAVIQEGNSTQVLPGIAVIELAVSNEYLEQESALLDGNFAVGMFPASAHLAFVRLVGAHRLLYAQSYSYLNQADRADLNSDVNPRIAAAVTAMENRLVVSDTPRRPPPVSAAAWNRSVATLSGQTQRAVGEAEARLAAQARSQAAAKLRGLYLTSGLGLAAIIASLVLSLWIAVNLTRQLRGLRNSALEMANVRLPELIRRLRAGEDVDAAAQVPRLDPGEDEIGQVEAAFNSAQRTAVEAAIDQARMRRGINDVFRNLARRSQSLLERQMALLDVLERNAVEPDDLEGLFRIDHLTTRMRRHAESLIVLAGDAPQRAFVDPVPFVDVLRAAAAEVEDYKRIRVSCRPTAALAGPAVADVIHLLAEFVENAATFSPDHTEVRITGELVARGFAVDIEDRGLGMTDDELCTVNASLAKPPQFDLSGSDQLGLFVAGQLARRHGIAVTLRHSAYGGVNAIVLIPLGLVVPDGKARQPRGRSLGGRAARVARHAFTPRSDAIQQPTEIGPPAAPLAGSPAGRGGLAEVTAGEVTAGEVTPDGITPADVTRPDLLPPFAPASASVAGGPAGPPAEERAPAAVTENGLPQRVRQRNLAPQLQGNTALLSRSDGGAEARTGPRSPESARGVMTAFQRGWRQGLSQPGSASEYRSDSPQDGEYR